MVRERRGERLDGWLAIADACALPAFRRFAKGLRADLDAARAELTEEWSNSPTEGFVHKRKLLKRQGYGRAVLGNMTSLRSAKVHRMGQRVEKGRIG